MSNWISTPLRRRFVVSGVLSAVLWLSTSASSNPSAPVARNAFRLGLGEAVAELVPGPTFAPLALSRVPRTLAPVPAPLEQAAASILTGERERDHHVLGLPFGQAIRAAARRHAVDELLLAAVVEAESSFRPDAVSPKGALGLMQLMPAHVIGVEEPLDPEVNLDLGAGYLANLHRRFAGDLSLTLGAYHAGPGTIDRFGGLPPFRETRTYVGRVLDRYREHQLTSGLVTSEPLAATIGGPF